MTYDTESENLSASSAFYAPLKKANTNVECETVLL